jgi:pimeloyl-ACP methyl ester carboxylesterase
MRISLFSAAACGLAVGIPADPMYFLEQRVDHFSVSDETFSQRYYENTTSFPGAFSGAPIIVILGGEGGIAPSTGIFYPSIVLLAERLGALVVEPEHRFYGESLPWGPGSYDTGRLQLLTAPQALADAALFIGHIREKYSCTGQGGQPRCPVITVGGSYPGWLSAMMRLRYPNVVDMAYAGSAPMRFYAQATDPFAYYAVVTDSAAKASPACPPAVRSMLAPLPSAPKSTIMANLNLCTPLPAYLQAGDATRLAQEVAMIVQYTFADLNMANYPPGPSTRLSTACAGIESAQAGGGSPWAALSSFLTGYSARRGAGGCYNMSAQLPSGANATISSGDWSGVGTGDDGSSWDFETCTLLVETIGTNNVTDMFPPRPWTSGWLQQHCASRFNVVPQPRALADLWGFDEARLPHVTSRIIFTNGLNDGWSAGGITTNLSATLLAFNAPNGAHHSDLSHSWPSSADTPDVQLVRDLAAATIEEWLADM